VFAAGSLSSLAGAALAGRAGRWLGAGPGMAAGLAVLGLGMLLVPLVRGPGALGFALLVAQQLGDGGEVVYSVHESSWRQAAPPAGLRGRVSAGVGFLAQGAMLAGAGAGAALGEALGPRVTLLAGALGVLAAALLVALSPAGRARAIGSAAPA
jgi:hypothetical protein